MSHTFKRIIILFTLFFALPMHGAEEVDAGSTKYIEQTLSSLESDLRDKQAFVNQYDTRRKSFVPMRSNTKAELARKKVVLYSVNYQNLFDLSSVYKEITTFPDNLKNSIFSTIQFDRMQETASGDKNRLETLKQSLTTIETANLDPAIVAKRDEAIKLCNTLIDINTKFIALLDRDEKQFNTLTEQTDNLATEGKNLRTVIEKTITGRSLSFPTYLKNWTDTYTAVKKEGADTFATSPDTSVKNTEFKFLWKSMLFCLVLSIGASYFVFGVWLRKIISKRGSSIQKPFLILVGTLLFFSLCLATLNSSGALEYYERITALGPEFLLTIMTVILALTVRLRQQKFWKGFLIYLPMIINCAVLISLRLASAPNIIVRMTLPVVFPIMAVLTAIILYHTKTDMPRFDRVMGFITLVFLTAGTILSWIGYAFIAFILLLFWNVLLCGILFMIAYWIIQKHFIDKHRGQAAQDSPTWLSLLSSRFIMPVMGLALLLFSIYWPLDVFDLGSLFIHNLGENLAVPRSSTGEMMPPDANALVKYISGWNIITVIFLAITINYLLNVAKKWLRDVYGDNYESGGIPTLVTLGSLIVWSIYVIASLIMLDANFNGIFVVLGGMSLGIGFALKDTIENIICGISLMFGRLKQGDIVDCDGVRGKVTSLGYRTTYMETSDGSIIAFQNTQLFSKNFRNLTQNHMYELGGVDIGIPYNTDFDKVKEIILDAIHNVNELSKIRTPAVFLDSFGDNAVNIKVLVWVPVNAKGGVMSKVREEIYSAFNQNGIEIPFPQQDVHIKEMPSAQPEKVQNDDEQASS